jgi:hypothetical protein
MASQKSWAQITSAQKSQQLRSQPKPKEKPALKIVPKTAPKTAPKTTPEPVIEPSLLTKQSQYTIREIIKFLPLLDQMALWETGDKTWRRLYKSCMLTTTTVLDFNEDFLRKLISNYKVPTKPKNLDGWKTQGGTEKIKSKNDTPIKNLDYPPIFTKIPDWIRFHKVTFGFSSNRRAAHFPQDRWVFILDLYENSRLNIESSPLGSLQNLLIRSSSTLREVEAERSFSWLFHIFTKKDKGKKIFSALANFSCDHWGGMCACKNHCMHLPGSGIYLMALDYYLKNKATFYIPEPENITEIHILGRLDQNQITECLTMFSEKIPNFLEQNSLQTIKLSVVDNMDRRLLYYYIKVFNSTKSKMVYIQTPVQKSQLDIYNKKHPLDENYGEMYSKLAFEIKQAVGTFGFGLALC